MNKKCFYLSIIVFTLSTLFIGCCLIYLGKSIRYGFTHQATNHGGLDLRDDFDLYSDFVIENIN